MSAKVDTGKIRNVVIIGSGPAGHTAAIYAARAMLEPLVIAGFQLGGPAGGQLMWTTEVENYPGYPEGVLGPTMMQEFRQQAERFGTEYFDGVDIKSVDFSERPFTLRGYNNIMGEDVEIKTKAVIVATGATANWLDRPGVEEFKNRGTSACAVCDGALPLFRDKELYVIGGGDSAVEEGTYLTKYANRVYLVHRRDELRASKAMQQRAFDNPKLEVLWNTELQSVRGNDFVEGVEIFNNKTKETHERPAGGVFMAIGHTPNTAVFEGHLDMDEAGYLKWTAPPRTYTSVPGVFAAGDVADHIYRQAVTAAGTGCAAAIDCERWLSEMGE